MCCCIESAEYLYVDTETTGLDVNDELLCVSVLDNDGKLIYHSLVRPLHKTCWEAAQKINGISPDMNSWTFPLIRIRSPLSSTVRIPPRAEICLTCITALPSFLCQIGAR